MRDITLRPACDEDRHHILTLEEDGMRRYAVALWGDWQPSATIENLALDGHEIVLLKELPVGCVLTQFNGDHLRIAKLYIASGSRGQGIGRFILHQKLHLAAHRRVPVRLSVLRTNPGARRFYEREGFALRNQTSERWLLENTGACDA